VSKPIHPIRKIVAAVARDVYGDKLPRNDRAERSVARHVKPLLDALDYVERFYFPPGPNQRKARDLVDAWRAKL
jgi:hypothetical protein